MEYGRELAVAKEAAVLAGEAIMETYRAGDFDVAYKDDESPLTAADTRANKIIADILSREFPDYAVLAEESEDDKSRLKNDYCFIVDPLDGTKEFIKGNGQFTVNIALAHKHRSVMGAVYVPVTGELYYAASGFGAYCEHDGFPTVRLKASERTSDLRLLLSATHGNWQEEKLIEKYDIKNFRRIGSSLKGCLIAKGEADVFYRYGLTCEWDTAAMQCVAEQAGAVFRQMDGAEMLYNREDTVNRKGFFIVNRAENALEL